MSDRRTLKPNSRWFSFFQSWLPAFLSARSHAWFTKVRPLPNQRFRIQLADRLSHFDQAFALLKNEFKAMSDLGGQPVFPTQCLLPTTATVVALWDERVVACVLISRPGRMGFISSPFVDQANLVKLTGSSIVEVIGFAVAPEEEKIGEQLLLYLSKYAYEFVLKFCGARFVLTAIERQNLDFYTGIMGFKPIPMGLVKPAIYSRPYLIGLVDLRRAQGLFDRFGCGYLGRFFNEPPQARMFFPGGDGLLRLSPSLLTALVGRSSVKAKTLSVAELGLLKSTYAESVYLNCFPEFGANVSKPAQRFESHKPVDLCHALGAIQGVTQNVSDRGLCVVFEQEPIRMRVGDVYRIELAASPKQRLSILSRIVWSRAGRVGFRLEDTPLAWKNWMKKLGSA